MGYFYASVSSRTSPKAQRSLQTNRTLRNPSSQSSPAGTHTHTLASSVSAHNCTFPTLIFYSIHIPLLFPSLSPFLFVSLPAVSRSPKPDDPALAGPSYLDTSSSSIASATPKSSGPTPLFTVDGEEEDDYYTIFFLQNCHLLKFFLCLIYDFCSFLYLLISICLLLSFSLAFSE